MLLKKKTIKNQNKNKKVPPPPFILKCESFAPRAVHANGFLLIFNGGTMADFAVVRVRVQKKCKWSLVQCKNTHRETQKNKKTKTNHLPCA